MNKLANVKSGEIYAIPLFLTNEPDNKSFAKDKFENLNNEFVFCRIIENLAFGGILIEVFNKKGHLNTEIEDIIHSQRLFAPITVSGVAIYKKRWKKIGTQDNYEKQRDSDFSEITLVAGVADDFTLWKGGQDLGYINELQAQNFESWTIWRGSQVEKRVLNLWK